MQYEVESERQRSIGLIDAARKENEETRRENEQLRARVLELAQKSNDPSGLPVKAPPAAIGKSPRAPVAQGPPPGPVPPRGQAQAAWQPPPPRGPSPAEQRAIGQANMQAVHPWPAPCPTALSRPPAGIASPLRPPTKPSLVQPPQAHPPAGGLGVQQFTPQFGRPDPDPWADFGGGVLQPARPALDLTLPPHQDLRAEFNLAQPFPAQVQQMTLQQSTEVRQVLPSGTLMTSTCSRTWTVEGAPPPGA